ncbi:MAG: hypothetical protein EAZ51_07415 [Sphingobacteriales bacterium]|nr:MAG: hypothetical protein EAZ51_07415 [Sphingobacteriales bacterium]
MIEPFDIEIENFSYSIFPEEEDVFTIFKEGIELMKIQKDSDTHWLKLDATSEMPLFVYDIEVELIGQQINLELGKLK